MVVNESEALVTMTAVSSDKISTYLADDIHLASESSADSLMSSSGRKRSVTRVKCRFYDRRFAAAGPRIWNNSRRDTEFKRQLKILIIFQTDCGAS